MYHSLAATIDALHALVMIGWGIGLPLLFWHRFRRLSYAYMIFASTFVIVSVVSHFLLGECVLTTLARKLWLLGGGYRDGVPFIALLANTVAGLRPTPREVVLVWEGAVLTTSAGTLWCWLRTRRREPPARDELS